VAERLAELGITVMPRYGVGGYRVDFAAAHPAEPGRMVLAIEADGASYRDSRSARDRDRLRKEHLERLGWTFHRIWSTNWFTDPGAEAARVERAYRQAVAAAGPEDGPAGPLPDAAGAPRPDVASPDGPVSDDPVPGGQATGSLIRGGPVSSSPVSSSPVSSSPATGSPVPGSPATDGLVSGGPVPASLVSSSPTGSSLVPDGLVPDGPVRADLAHDGPADDGPADDGPAHDGPLRPGRGRSSPSGNRPARSAGCHLAEESRQHMNQRA
jgi:very-short-patch-repair endonuclease